MLLFLLSSLFLVYISIRFYYKNIYLFNKHLKQFPSPPEIPILGHALDFTTGKEVLDVLYDYIKNYGEVVRIKTGPYRHLLLVADNNFSQFILTNAKMLNKGREYRFFESWLGKGLLTSKEPKWRKHRQIIAPTFHFQILENFIDIFDSNAKILLKKFEQYLDMSSVDIYKDVNLCTLDIISESAMGTSINAQESSASDYVKSVETMCEIFVSRIFTPHKMIDWMYIFTEDYRREQKALKIIHSHAWNIIKSREEVIKSQKPEGKKKKAFLDMLLELTGEQLSLEEIREEVDTFMFAGHDTTGTSIAFTLYCLANHPEEQSKLIVEQKEIFGDDFNRPVSFKDIKKMKYLEYAIKESLRLYPPVLAFSRELDEDVDYNGTILPKGLPLSIFVYALHRNSKYFPEPEKFVPSRFETVDGKTPFAFLPFSAGVRNCIGQTFAMTEMKSIVSRILQNFELLPAVPEHYLELSVKTILTSCNGVRVRFRKRT